MNFNDWIALTRAEHAAMVSLTVVIAQAIVLKKFSLELVLPAIGPALITLGAFALNDFLDYASDKANKRMERPLVAKTILPQHALIASAFSYAVGLLACFLLSGPKQAFLLASTYAFLSIAYDALLKKLPLVGNLFIASAMSISFLYGNLAAGSELNYFILLFALMAFLAGLGRELLITLRDVKGDKKAGALTLPMLLGERRTVIAANALFYSAIVVSLLPLLEKIFLPYAAAIIVADALFVVTALKTSLDAGKASLKQARNYTLWASIIGLLAFASLAFT